MVGEATVERPAIPEAKKRASNGLMLHIAHGEFDNTKTADLKKDPKEIAPKTFDTLDDINNAEREKQAEKWNTVDREILKQQGWPEDKITPELLRHMHMVSWAKAENRRIKSMFVKTNQHYAQDPEGKAGAHDALITSLGKLKITFDANSDAQNFADQFYKTNPDNTGIPGEFYTTFCTGGNMHQKLLDALKEEDIIVLKDFLTDTLGSPTAYDALLATKQTQDAIAANHDFSTDSSSLPLHEYSLLEFFSKGPSLPNPTKEKTVTVVKDKEPDKVDGGYTLSHPEHPDRNDDISFLDPEHRRGGIFDGAGGYTGSDKASKAALEAIREVMDRFPLKGDYPENPIREQMLEAFAVANDRVKALGSGMTTAAVWQIVRSAKDGTTPKLLVGNIGDSRVWIRHKDGTVTQVTKDGSQLRSLHKQALSEIPQGAQDPRFQDMRDEEVRNYDDLQTTLDNAQKLEDLAGNPLLEKAWMDRRKTGLLGNDEFKQWFEFFESPIQEGDTVFMTTDGVHDNLTREEIEAIAKQTTNPDELSKQLVMKSRSVADTFETTNQEFRAKPDDITAAAQELHLTQTTAVDKINQPVQSETTPTPAPEKIVELANQAYWYMRRKSQEPLPVAEPGAIAFASSGNEALMSAMGAIRNSSSDFGEHFYGHGIAKGSTRDQLQALVNILQGQEAKGSSTAVSLGNANTNYPVYSDGGFVIIGPKDTPLLKDDNTFHVGLVAVNEQFYEAIPTLESWFPGVQFVKADDLPAVLEKQA